MTGNSKQTERETAAIRWNGSSPGCSSARQSKKPADAGSRALSLHLVLLVPVAVRQAGAGRLTDRVLAASPDDAMDFLSERVTPATQRDGSPREVSSVTRERYCMVLRGVYGQIVRLGQLTENPC